MSDPALLPCPFCGGDNLDFTDEQAGNKTYFAVLCVTCGAQGPDCVCIDDMNDAWSHRGSVSAEDLSRWRAQYPERLISAFKKVLLAAEAKGRHDDPNRLPLELIPPGWHFESVVADRGTYIAELWSNDDQKWVSSGGETPRIAFLNAIESVSK